MIDGQNFFNQPVKNDLRKYDSIQKIATGQGDDYTTHCLLDYIYFNNYYKREIDLCKKQPLDANSKAIQQINFTGNLIREGLANTTMFFIIEDANHFIFFIRNCCSIIILFLFNIISI